MNRGHAREMLRDAPGACQDWQKAAELGLETGSSYAANSGCAAAE